MHHSHGLIIFYAQNLFPLVCQMSIPCATYLIIYLCTFHFMLTALPITVPLLLILPCHPLLLLALIGIVSQLNIEKYQQMVIQHLSSLPLEVANCSDVSCTCHHMHDSLDSYAQHLVNVLLHCSHHCFPCHTASSSRKLIGWKDGSSKLKEDANFWYRVWDQAGRPSTGTFFTLKKHTKKKASVRSLKRKQQRLAREKIARSFLTVER